MARERETRLPRISRLSLRRRRRDRPARSGLTSSPFQESFA